MATKGDVSWRCRGEMTQGSRTCRQSCPTARVGRGLKLTGLEMDIGVICAEVNVNPIHISGEEKME